MSWRARIVVFAVFSVFYAAYLVLFSLVSQFVDSDFPVPWFLSGLGGIYLVVLALTNLLRHENKLDLFSTLTLFFVQRVFGDDEARNFREYSSKNSDLTNIFFLILGIIGMLVCVYQIGAWFLS